MFPYETSSSFSNSIFWFLLFSNQNQVLTYLIVIKKIGKEGGNEHKLIHIHMALGSFDFSNKFLQLF